MIDPDYGTSIFKWNAQSKELLVFFIGGIILSPLIILLPVVYLTLCYTSARYYYVHRRSHEEPEWAKKHLPWHYDHHMGSNQDFNWCVTRPWFDLILGTRRQG